MENIMMIRDSINQKIINLKEDLFMGESKEMEL